VNIPAIRLISGRNILGKSDVNIVFNRNFVGVVKDDKTSQFLMSRKRGCLRGDAFLQVAIARDDIGVMVKG